MASISIQHVIDAPTLVPPEQRWEDRNVMEKVSVNPGKALEEFRNYTDSSRHSIVELHYRKMRENQTVDFVRRMYEKYHSFDKAKMTVWEAFEALRDYVDSSDPDSELPNLEHMLQTAEAIRAAGHPDWFQLVGLLHDMGKIMFLWGEEKDGQIGRADFPQWALGGDTWVVGVPLPDSVVFPEFNDLNPDRDNKNYQGPYGMYAPNCGLENLLFAYGHDEYMYRMLIHNKTTIPKEGLAMIRYHSCYPCHRGGAYKELLSPGDEELMEWVTIFNEFDLYTKADQRPIVEDLWPYYQSLIDKYLPGKLDW
jgi:inositol oxygenase